MCLCFQGILGLQLAFSPIYPAQYLGRAIHVKCIAQGNIVYVADYLCRWVYMVSVLTAGNVGAKLHALHVI